jgi:butyryl-CoA dehydrogenase
MIYGDNEGATGWLIGEENQGLACMFTMMNNARLMVGVQGVALAETATQEAIAFAKERRQGRSTGTADGTSAIIQHPDVRRMLVEMRAKTAAARMLCMATAAAIDGSLRAESENERTSARVRAALLTPLAKAYSTDIAVEVTSLAIQVHGGMGFIEETGVAQLYRDARILPIYEGTNGIQAIDLVTRKLTPDGITAALQVLASCRNSVALAVSDARAEDIGVQVGRLVESIGATPRNVEMLVAATPILRTLAVAVAGGYFARAAELAQGNEFDDQANINARYILNVELPSALTAANAMLAEAQTVVNARFD